MTVTKTSRQPLQRKICLTGACQPKSRGRREGEVLFDDKLISHKFIAVFIIMQTDSDRLFDVRRFTGQSGLSLVMGFTPPVLSMADRRRVKVVNLLLLPLVTLLYYMMYNPISITDNHTCIHVCLFADIPSNISDMQSDNIP